MSNVYTLLKWSWISVGCKLIWQIEFWCQKSGIDLKWKRTGPKATALGSITAAKWIVNKIKSESRRQTQFNTLSNCQLYTCSISHSHPPSRVWVHFHYLCKYLPKMAVGSWQEALSFGPCPSSCGSCWLNTFRHPSASFKPLIPSAALSRPLAKWKLLYVWHTRTPHIYTL